MPPAKSARGSRPRAVLFWGQEDLRKQEALRSLIDELVPPEDQSLDVQYLDPTQSGVTGETILNAARDRAMFSEQRVVVVPNAGRMRGSKFQKTLEVLAEGIPTLPEFGTLIFVAWAEEAGERAGRNPFPEKLVAAIKSVGKVQQFALMKPDELRQLAASEAAKSGKKLLPAAAAMLVERAGPDSRVVLQETRKLIAYAGDGDTITPRDVNELVPPKPEENVWNMLGATLAGNRREALRLLDELLSGGHSPHQVMPLLSRTLRDMVQAKYLQERGVSAKAEADAVRPDFLEALPKEGGLYSRTAWQRGRLWEQSARISWPHLQAAVDRLALTEAGTKGWDTGIEDPALALEVFISSLSDAVRPSAR